jgi:hypothetical protein
MSALVLREVGAIGVADPSSSEAVTATLPTTRLISQQVVAVYEEERNGGWKTRTAFEACASENF